MDLRRESPMLPPPPPVVTVSGEAVPRNELGSSARLEQAPVVPCVGVSSQLNCATRDGAYLLQLIHEMRIAE